MRYLPILFLAAAAASAADLRDFSTWRQFEGGADASQYSSLQQINKSNVNQLQIAWTYATGERGNYI
jgi:quinoprotein glucose dehydrogenase